MTTVLQLGPADHGRPLSYEEFTTGDYAAGHKYELIDGRLYVAPAANLSEDSARSWLTDNLKAYAASHPSVINYVTPAARVFVPDREDLTVPEPDLAAFHNFPHHLPFHQRRWELVSPLLVAEVLSSDPHKDLERNPDLYFQVPSIREYWVADVRMGTGSTFFRVYRRFGRRWRILDFALGQTYTTRLLPGFNLTLNVDL